MATPYVTKGGLAGTNKGKTAIKEEKIFGLFLNGQFIGTKMLRLRYFSLQRGKRRKYEPYKV